MTPKEIARLNGSYYIENEEQFVVKMAEEIVDHIKKVLNSYTPNHIFYPFQKNLDLKIMILICKKLMSLGYYAAYHQGGYQDGPALTIHL